MKPIDLVQSKVNQNRILIAKRRDGVTKNIPVRMGNIMPTTINNKKGVPLAELESV